MEYNLPLYLVVFIQLSNQDDLSKFLLILYIFYCAIYFKRSFWFIILKVGIDFFISCDVQNWVNQVCASISKNDCDLLVSVSILIFKQV
jgi:hypothetical protein